MNTHKHVTQTSRICVTGAQFFQYALQDDRKTDSEIVSGGPLDATEVVVDGARIYPRNGHVGPRFVIFDR